MENNHSQEKTQGEQKYDVNVSRESKLPLSIILAALMVYFSFQTLQLISQRSELSAIKTAQEAPLQASNKIHEQFNTVMKKTNELAKKGHAGAKMVLEGLQKPAGAEQN